MPTYKCVSVAGATRRLPPGAKILVVEDNYMIATLLASCVEDMGGLVTGPFADADSAMEAITLQHPVAALVDLALTSEGPEYDVVDALLGGGIPVVVVSGYERGDAPMAYQGLSWLTKPTCYAEIRNAVLHALAGVQTTPSIAHATWDVGNPSGSFAK